MSFDVDPDAYARFMGRFSGPLAAEFVSLLGLRDGDRALDVGCGTGALTSVFVDTLGAASVAAVDPSEPFVASVRARYPLVDCRRAAAEDLPFETGAFDVAAAQLVVHFMADPVRGLREMARVTRPGGTVAANVWDYTDGSGPLAPFGEARRSVDPQVHDARPRTGALPGDLEALFVQSGLVDVRASVATVEVAFASFDEWWQPFTLGVGPVGEYVAALTTEQVAALRQACAARLPRGAFTTVASAWVAVGTAP